MPTTRRSMIRASSLTAASVLLPQCRGVAATTGPEPTAFTSTKGAEPMLEYVPKPLPFDPTTLVGLSEKLLRSHYDNNYLGAVRKLDGVRQRLAETTDETPGYVLHGLAQGELAFKHSVVLHELYFGGLVGGGSSGSATKALLAERFGGAEAWERRFRALGGSLGGGSGWAIIEYDLHQRTPRMYSAADHGQGLSSGIPLLVLDMYEHSYHMDYGTAAARYIDAFLANVHWEEIDRRTELALRLPDGLF